MRASWHRQVTLPQVQGEWSLLSGKVYALGHPRSHCHHGYSYDAASRCHWPPQRGMPSSRPHPHCPTLWPWGAPAVSSVFTQSSSWPPDGCSCSRSHPGVVSPLHLPPRPPMNATSCRALPGAPQPPLPWPGAVPCLTQTWQPVLLPALHGTQVPEQQLCGRQWLPLPPPGDPLAPSGPAGPALPRHWGDFLGPTVTTTQVICCKEVGVGRADALSSSGSG